MLGFCPIADAPLADIGPVQPINYSPYWLIIAGGPDLELTGSPLTVLTASRTITLADGQSLTLVASNRTLLIEGGT